MIRPTTFTVVDCCGSSCCRCGRRCDIGAISIMIGDLTVSLTVTASGVRWPLGITIPPSLAARLEPEIEQAWLKHLGERWENAREIARGWTR